MGKQVNFYMLPDDERIFLEYVESTGDIYLLPARMKTKEINPLSEPSPIGEPFCYAQFLWNKSISPVPIVDYIEQQEMYYPNIGLSEIIEWSRCSFDENNQLRSGRIWAEMNGLQKEKPHRNIRKSAAFEKWYDKIARWIRKNTSRDNKKRMLFPHASAALANKSMTLL